MKKNLPNKLCYIFVLCSLLFFNAAKGQNYVTIPDTNFAAFLQQTFPACMNGNQMDTTCAAIVNATTLNCMVKNIADLTGVQYFDNLQLLQCYSNQLTSLPPLPNYLTDLSCYSNRLTSLPTLPNSLTSLFCSNNQLGSLPTLPNSLTNIYCDNNQLTGLPALPNSLRSLSCRQNLLNSLPVLPGLLTGLDCTSNQITTLPLLPDSLMGLTCSSNRLDSLPALPNSMASLWCDGNLLTSLPALSNSSLTELYCFNNPLSSLPTLPHSLIKLHCYNSQLTSLPVLPDTLSELDCANAQLTSLPSLPASLFLFLVNGNPNLYCMPPLKKLTGVSYSFSISGTHIKCLPNVIQHSGSIPGIDTMPVCDLFNNPNDCELGWNVQGTVFNDGNHNCSFQNGESKIPYVKISLYQGGNLVESAYFEGSYSFKTGFATYTVELDTVGLPFNFCRMDTLLAVTAQDSLKYNIDFGLECKPGFDVGAKGIAGRFAPSRVSPLYITAGDLSNYYKAHCSAGRAGSVTVTISGPAKYIGPATGALTPSSSNDSTITWNFSDFASTSFDSSFNILVQTDTTAQVGQQVCITVVVNPIEGDKNPTNNILTECFAVHRSLDPNVKEAYPISIVDTADGWITYTIHFQNTGTDTAKNIIVSDTLNPAFDISTFQLLAYSSKTISQIYGSRIVQFNFPSINLPDSGTNEARSHGYVQFKIKLLDNILPGTQITNTAFIYFDFNTPVATNTTLNTVTSNVATSIASQMEGPVINIFPNPANDKLFITVTRFKPEWITVYDISGQKLIEQRFTKELDIHTLTAGIYVVEVRSNNEIARKRVVKIN